MITKFSYNEGCSLEVLQALQQICEEALAGVQVVKPLKYFKLFVTGG